MYFKIPYSFIDIQIVQILSSLTITVFALIVLLMMIKGFVINIPNAYLSNPLKRMILIIWGIVITIVLFIFLFATGSLEIYLIIIVIGIIFSGSIIWRFYDLKKNILNEMRSTVAENPHINSDQLTEKVLNKIIPEESNKDMFKSILDYSLIIIVILPLIFLIVGYGSASSTKQFYSFTNNKSMLIIKKYGDDIICKNYNSKTKQIGDSLFIFKFTENHNLLLTEVDLKN